MQLEEVKISLYKLEQLMYGHNYEVCFGIEWFENCESYDNLKIKLKEIFPESRPEQITPILFDNDAFWEELNYCLQYRGDNSAGLILNQTDQLKVEGEQKIYIDFLNTFISDNSKIFSYPDDTGIPGYPVFWDYRFIIFNEQSQCLFTYGSSSD